jgi:hypothetical protein
MEEDAQVHWAHELIDIDKVLTLTMILQQSDSDRCWKSI